MPTTAVALDQMTPAMHRVVARRQDLADTVTLAVVPGCSAARVTPSSSITSTRQSRLLKGVGVASTDPSASGEAASDR